MLDFSTAPINPETSRPQHIDDTAEVKRYLVDTLETWLPRLLPGGRINGRDFVAGSTNGEKGNSLHVCLRGDSRGLWIDYAGTEMDKGDVFTLIEKCLGTDFVGAMSIARDMANIPMPRREVKDVKEEQRDRSQQDAAYIEAIHRELKLIHGSPVVEYLWQRKILARPTTDDVLFHPSLTHWPTKTVWPAMVALVRDVGCRIVGLHRTYIDPSNNEKANVEPNKMMLGQCKGGAVRLAPITQDGVLGISEGIETGLAAMELYPGIPVWAALSTSGMRAIEMPAEARSVAVFADAGAPGEAAATDLASRLAAEGRITRVVRPLSGDDFNEDLRRVKA